MRKKKKFESLEAIEQEGMRVVRKEDKLQTIICHVQKRLKETNDSAMSVANLLGMKRQTLHRQFSHPEDISLLSALKMAKLLSCSVEDLFEIGRDGWLVEYPFEKTRTDIQFLNLQTLEMVSNQEMRKTGWLYYNERSGEVIDKMEYTRRLQLRYKEFPNTPKAEVEELFQKDYPCLYAKVVKDMYNMFEG